MSHAARPAGVPGEDQREGQRYDQRGGVRGHQIRVKISEKDKDSELKSERLETHRLSGSQQRCSRLLRQLSGEKHQVRPSQWNLKGCELRAACDSPAVRFTAVMFQAAASTVRRETPGETRAWCHLLTSPFIFHV